jgi:hypothetical protein
MKAHVAQWKAAQADLERVTETLTEQRDPPVHPLNKIADQVRFLAAELEAGETIDPYDLGMIARRIDA